MFMVIDWTDCYKSSMVDYSHQWFIVVYNSLYNMFACNFATISHYMDFKYWHILAFLKSATMYTMATTLCKYFNGVYCHRHLRWGSARCTWWWRAWSVWHRGVGGARENRLRSWNGRSSWFFDTKKWNSHIQRYIYIYISVLYYIV